MLPQTNLKEGSWIVQENSRKKEFEIELVLLSGKVNWKIPRIYSHLDQKYIIAHKMRIENEEKQMRIRVDLGDPHLFFILLRNFTSQMK